MRPRLVLTLCSGVILGVIAACSTRGDLNQQCTLVKADDAGHATPLHESEIPNTHTDFISFGASECDDLVCVRDALFPRDADAGDIAYGYCSSPCTPGIANQCQSFSGDYDLNYPLSCRPLLLDAQTLAAICNQDAGACQEFFSNTRSPYFCARGSTPDGGADGG